MNIPNVSHPLWKEIILGKKQVQFDFLAARMLVGRISIMLSTDNSEENIYKATEELHSVFAKNINLPKVQKDLTKIFGEGGLK